MVWEEVWATDQTVKHPLVPLIQAWFSGPVEVLPAGDASGTLRGDTIAPRIAMRESSGAKSDRLYLAPAHIGEDGSEGQIVLSGFGEGKVPGRISALPVNLYDLGVTVGEARGGRGAAPIPARMLVKLAAAPSAFVRHSERLLTFEITLRDLRGCFQSIRDILTSTDETQDIPKRSDGRTMGTPVAVATSGKTRRQTTHR